MRPKLI